MSKRTSPSDAALSRVRAICYGFPGTEEKLSHGAPSFHVRGKMFLNFVDDHHADGRLAVWCKCSFERQRELVALHPDRYFVPPYVGVRGWIGARLDQPTTDWVELAIVIEEGWIAIAPPKLARGEGARPGPPKPPPPRPTTDEKVARASLEQLTKICLALPGASREREARHATFVVGKKTFAYFLDNHHGDAMILACVRGGRAENEKLVNAHPKHYCSPAYIGKRGWLGIRLEAARVDWKGIAERVRASYEEVAPKRRAAAPASPKRSSPKQASPKRSSPKPSSPKPSPPKRSSRRPAQRGDRRAS